MYVCLVSEMTSLPPAITRCAIKVFRVFRRLERSLDQNHTKLQTSPSPELNAPAIHAVGGCELYAHMNVRFVDKKTGRSCKVKDFISLTQ